MAKIKFVNSRYEAQWSWQLPDGRFIVILSFDGKFEIRYDTPFNLETGEIAKLPKEAPRKGDTLPDYTPEGFTTLNNLKAQGQGRTVYCYDEYDLFVGEKPRITGKKSG